MEDLSLFAVSMSINMGLVFPPPIEMDSLDESVKCDLEDINNNTTSSLKTRSTSLSLSADFIRIILEDQVQYANDFNLIKYWAEESEIVSGTSQRSEDVYLSLNSLSEYYKSTTKYTLSDVAKTEIEKCLETKDKEYETKRVYWFVDVESFVKSQISCFSNLANASDSLEVFVFGNISFMRHHIEFMKSICDEFQKCPEKMKLHLIMCDRDILEIRESLTSPKCKGVRIVGELIVGSMPRCEIKIEGIVKCHDHWKNGTMNVNVIGFVEQLEDWMYDEELETYQITSTDEKSGIFEQVKLYLKDERAAFCQCFIESKILEYCLIFVVGEKEDLKLIRLKEDDAEKWKKYLDYRTVSSVEEKLEVQRENLMYKPIGAFHEKTIMKRVKELLQKKETTKNSELFKENYNSFIDEYRILGFEEEIEIYLKEVYPQLFID